jgi:hypothetical protein
MHLIGSIIKGALKLGQSRKTTRLKESLRQADQLFVLLGKAKETSFGQHYNFDSILEDSNFVESYQNSVPITDYDTMHKNWWAKSLADEPNVTWPGEIPYFALSSGTSAFSSKALPITKDIIASYKKASRKMFYDLSKFNLSSDQFMRSMLLIGSGTSLVPKGEHMEGDLSGILALNRPSWLANYYKPEKEITEIQDWDIRIQKIIESANQWDIGFVVGNPMWVYMIFKGICEHYKIKTIHEIWPHFKVYVHGGVFFEPYKQGFESMLAEPVHYIDTYMASEGFFGYQRGPEHRDLQLVTNNGIFYEFVELNEGNQDEDGNIFPKAKAVPIWDVKADIHYALIVSTPAGTWRYSVGDTIMFTDIEKLTFRITGRIKQFLSSCGEHLSLDNINAAVNTMNEVHEAGILEFSVSAEFDGKFWAHHWWFSSTNENFSSSDFVKYVDEELVKGNDDYAVERKYALKNVYGHKIPNDQFHDWLKHRGKNNGQAKIPRVLKGETMEDWKAFIAQEQKFSTTEI